MGHPYSGPAGYIYANERLKDSAIYDLFQTYERPSPWTPASPYSLSKTKPASPIYDRASSSVPQFSTAHHYRGNGHHRQMSTSTTHVAQKRFNTYGMSNPYLHEPQKVRFDLGNDPAHAWCRQLKTIRKKFRKLRRDAFKLLCRDSRASSPRSSFAK